MRPWRDLISVETFRAQRKDKDKLDETGGRTKLFGPSKATQLKLLENALADYHRLDKRSANLLDLRQNKLALIHNLAGQWFTLFKINRNDVKAELKSVR